MVPVALARPEVRNPLLATWVVLEDGSATFTTVSLTAATDVGETATGVYVTVTVDRATVTVTGPQAPSLEPVGSLYTDAAPAPTSAFWLSPVSAADPEALAAGMTVMYLVEVDVLVVVVVGSAEVVT